MTSRKNILEDIALKKIKIQSLAEEHKSTLNVQLLVSSAEQNLLIKEEFKDNMCHLHSGDIWIMLNGKLLYLFERKTLADLSSSLKDKRWRGQKIKMSRMPIAANRTFYLIEDKQSLSNDLGDFIANRNSIIGAQVNAIVRDGRRILRTIDAYETVYWILSLVEKSYTFGEKKLEMLKDYPTIDNKFDPMKSNVLSVKRPLSSEDNDVESTDDEASKIGNKYIESRKKSVSVNNPTTFYINFLKGIPRIGKKSDAIMKVYPNLVDLIKFIGFSKLDKKTIINKLKSIECVTSDMGKKSVLQQKKRKTPTVGPAIATCLYNYVLNL